MNAVEIEEAISALAEQPFDAEEFPFSFLEAFGNKETTLKRLRSGATNKSDLGGVLQTGNIHLKVCPPGEVGATLEALRESPATAKGKVQYLVATDGTDFEAEDLTSGETVACPYDRFPDHFGFFLSLAGISTVKEIRENAFDIKATGRLNRLYVQLLRDNPDWGTADRRNDMNHFMARLIFCFFSEDTDIFSRSDLFTGTIEQMGERDGSNLHEIIFEIFRCMNTKPEDREAKNIARWTLKPNPFPYVNGGLFAGTLEVPKFTKIARSYLLHIGNLDWKKINPDIFGSMIQAVADDEERGELGMHYTSVPNILKVLNPLFLDELREQLEEAGDNPRKLLNLRNRLAKIRVFDPACGSGNFLVIAYKEMRAIEAEINKRRGETDRRTVIPITNFRGIEIRDFSAEVARLALIIAEYQCDVLYRGQKEAIQDFLPLRVENWITCGNSLRLDWLSVCRPAGTEVKHRGDDLFFETKPQHEIDFENEGGETYICGNPPFKGARKQESSAKEDLKLVFNGHSDFKDADYVMGWFLKASEYCHIAGAKFGLVSTSSIVQGEQVQKLWPRLWEKSQEIYSAHVPFKWQNNAANNAGVYVVIVCIRPKCSGVKTLFSGNEKRFVENISPYLTQGESIVVRTSDRPISENLSKMIMGNMARDDGNLIMSPDEARELIQNAPESSNFLKPLYGTKELIGGIPRIALHLDIDRKSEWNAIPQISKRVEKVREFRSTSKAKTTNGYASVSHRFAQYCHQDRVSLAVPSVVPEDRSFVTPVLLHKGAMVTNLAYLIYGFGMYEFAILSSALHIVWARSVSGRHGSGVRYTPTVGFHTFPVPLLTEKNKSDLIQCAEDILLAREAHFPATIADLYDPDKMPADLKAAHDRNDEVLERIYIGRRFKNDTERLEKLFDLYTKMTTTPTKKGAAR